MSGYQLYKSYDEHGRVRYLDAIAGAWVSEVDDNEAFDMLEIRITLRHNAWAGDSGMEIQKAGVNYTLPQQQVYTHAKSEESIDTVLVDVVGEKARDAIRMLLGYRRSIDHKHTKHLRSNDG